jgi:pimeloyl-ACP methyl ester carboxylesterase
MLTGCTEASISQDQPGCAELQLSVAPIAGTLGCVQRFTSYDGTELAYRLAGRGRPLVCLPGGPGRAADYLGDLGGLPAHRQLVLLDNRGTGASATPGDVASYRCDRLVDDVEALRTHLGLDRLDLLGHSAAGNTATLYAARHPHRLDRLILLTPGLRAVGIELTEDEWLAAIRRRAGEPWYADAYAALMAWDAGEDTAHNRSKAAPLFYGRWDDEIAAHAASDVGQRTAPAAVHFADDGAFDPEQTRAALTEVTAPVLVYAGELDPAPAPRQAGELAALFPRGDLVVQPGAGHFPWLDDPAWFVEAVVRFLAA